MRFKLIILLLGLAIISFSSYMVYNLVEQHNQLEPQTKLRFKFLFFLHIFLALSLVFFVQITSTYHQIISAFFILLPIFVAIFICESLVSQNYSGPNESDQNDGLILSKKKQLPLQILYTDVYYLVYMYSIMGIMLTGIYLIVSEIVLFFQNWAYKRQLDRIFESIDYDACMKGGDCAICLGEFAKESEFMKIRKCGHIFHEDCIKEWTKYNKTCPLDRRDLTQ